MVKYNNIFLLFNAKAAVLNLTFEINLSCESSTNALRKLKCLKQCVQHGFLGYVYKCSVSIIRFEVFNVTNSKIIARVP